MTRDEVVHTRCTTEEKNRWTAAAEIKGSRLGPFSRTALEHACAGTLILPEVARGEKSARDAARDLAHQCNDALEILGVFRRDYDVGELADDLTRVTDIITDIKNKLAS